MEEIQLEVKLWKSAEMIGTSDDPFQCSVVPLTVHQGFKVLSKNP